MPWSSGQPDAGPPVFSSQANLILILSIHLRDDKLSQPCPVPGSNLGPLTAQEANHCASGLRNDIPFSIFSLTYKVKNEKPELYYVACCYVIMLLISKYLSIALIICFETHY